MRSEDPADRRDAGMPVRDARVTGRPTATDWENRQLPHGRARWPVLDLPCPGSRASTLVATANWCVLYLPGMHLSLPAFFCLHVMPMPSCIYVLEPYGLGAGFGVEG